MDALLQNTIELEALKSPAQRLAEALELMDWGIRLKREQLAADHPNASTEEVDRLLRAWLCRDD